MASQEIPNISELSDSEIENRPPQKRAKQRNFNWQLSQKFESSTEAKNYVKSEKRWVHKTVRKTSVSDKI